MVLKCLLREADMGVDNLHGLTLVVALDGQGHRLVKSLPNDEVKNGFFGGLDRRLRSDFTSAAILQIDVETGLNHFLKPVVSDLI